MASPSSPHLILFTPRAGEGINHAWVVTDFAHGDSDAAGAYSDEAARSLTGPGYLAVCHEVDQVTRGQVRPGAKEYLILAELPRLNRPTQQRLLQTLAGQIASLASNPIVPDNLAAGKGLLYTASRLAPLESELLAILDPKGGAPSSGAVRSSANGKPSFIQRALKGALVMIFAAGLALGLVYFGVKPGLAHFRSSHHIVGSEPADVWAFLGRPEWHRLIVLTHLPGNATSEERAAWAHALLAEFDGVTRPAPAAPNEPATLRDHPMARTLLNELNSLPPNPAASREPLTVPAAFLDQWPSPVKAGIAAADDAAILKLQTFARAYGDTHPGTTPATLRRTILAWQDTLETYLHLPALIRPEPLVLPFLTPADAQRFAELDARFRSPGVVAQFETLVATHNWSASSWSQRLASLQTLETSATPLSPDFAKLVHVLASPAGGPTTTP